MFLVRIKKRIDKKDGDLNIESFVYEKVVCEEESGRSENCE